MGVQLRPNAGNQLDLTAFLFSDIAREHDVFCSSLTTLMLAP